MAKIIRCRGNNSIHNNVRLIVSRRANDISFRVEGGDEWAHLNKTQAVKLAKWILSETKDIHRQWNVIKQNGEKV